MFNLGNVENCVKMRLINSFYLLSKKILLFNDKEMRKDKRKIVMSKNVKKNEIDNTFFKKNLFE